LQAGEQVLRIDDLASISHISHAFFFDQVPLPGRHSQDTRDDLVEQRWDLLAG
jgi:hypothetical protein